MVVFLTGDREARGNGEGKQDHKASMEWDFCPKLPGGGRNFRSTLGGKIQSVLAGDLELTMNGEGKWVKLSIYPEGWTW